MATPQKDKHQQVFNGGVDSDTAPEAMPHNKARYFLNCRSFSYGQEGNVTNIKGNTLITTPLPTGENKAIGYGSDEENGKFYFFVWNANGYHTIFAYDDLQNIITKILQSRTDCDDVDILRFNKKFRINHVDIVQNNLIYWVDGYNKARKFNIAKALDKSNMGYGYTIYEEFITACKLAPTFAPTCKYITDTTRNSNSLYGKLFKFCCRYIYDDGEISNWSDYSAVPLPPDESYLGVNDITFNNNCIQVQVGTGSQLVVKVELAMKVGSLDFVSTVVLDKAQLGMSNDVAYTYLFYNDGADTPTVQSKIIRAYSALPDRPYAQSFVHNAMTYSNFNEGFPVVQMEGDVTVTYEDIYLPPGEVDKLNNPSFIANYAGVVYDRILVRANRRNTIYDFTVGFDVKKGNIFRLFGNNGETDNMQRSYEATEADTAITVANVVKGWLREIKRVTITNESIDGDGNVKWTGQTRGAWREAGMTWTTSVNPVNYQTLKDNGLSIPLIKPGSVKKYAFYFHDDDGRKSLAYTADSFVARSGFITEIGELKRPVHTLTITSKPPIWAKYVSVVRTDEPLDYIELLIQKVIPITTDDGSEYIDLAVGSLFTYQKLHPNTVLVYDFERGDRLRPIKNTDTGILYPFFETEVLSYLPSVTELKNINVTSNGSSTVTIDSTVDENDIGKYILINGIERVITGVSGSSGYVLDGNMVGVVSSDPGTTRTYPNYSLIDRRGVIRIKKPVGITLTDFSTVELFKPQKNSDSYKQFKDIQMKFDIINWGTDTRAFRGNVQDQNGATPAIIKIISGDAFIRNRELPTNNSVPGTQVVIEPVVDPNFSDFYESNLKDGGLVYPQDDGSGVKLFDSRIRFSNNYIQDTKINGLNDFDPLDREDYNDQYGGIKLTKYRESRLWVFKPLKTCWVPVFQSIIKDNSDQQIVGTSSKLLNQIQHLTYDGGIGNNPESYVSNENYQYIASVNSGAFLRIAGDGCDPISSIYKYDTESRKLLSTAAKFGLEVIGGFDKEYKEVLWSIPDYIDYLYQSGFTQNEWSLSDPELPAGTVYAIVTQPANSVATLDGDGHTLTIAAGNVLGADFLTYSATPPGGPTVVRKKCFNVTEPANRTTGFIIDPTSAYCLKTDDGPPDPPTDNMFVNNDSASITIAFISISGPQTTTYPPTAAGVHESRAIIPGVYTVVVKTTGVGNRSVDVNGEVQTTSANVAMTFSGKSTTLFITVNDI